MADLVGRTLGKYRLVARLGRGGMAEVYKAYQPGMDRYVSIKVLHSYMLDDPNFIARFEREALAIGRLRHPNIVQAFDFDRDGDISFMAMEFIDGPTLKDELEARRTAGKPYSLQEIARIFCALSSAIDYAHTHGMVHRDLKPANVMLNLQGQVVLTDFGITRIVGATSFTQTGALSGTPAYMSPEQGQGQHGDERSDIYSLGVMLYEMVTGVVPFDADTPFAIIMKHISEPLPLPTRIAPHLPTSVERIILKAMSKNPADRFQQAGELARALCQAVGLAPGEEHLPLPIVAPRPQGQQIDHATGTFPARERPSTTAVPPRGTTVPPARPLTPPTPPPPASRVPWLPLLIGGGLILILALGGIAGGAFLLSQTGPPTPKPPTAVSVAEATATVTPNLIETAEAIANATGTARANAQATVVAASAGPTQTAQAATAQAEATAAQQTREAEIIAGIISAQAATATAETIEAGTATAEAQQLLATQTAIAQATAQAAEVQATQAYAATQTAVAQVTQTAAVQATQTAQAQAAQAAAAQTSAVSGTFNDFEVPSTWKRGDEPNGTFERSTTQAHAGRYAGQLNYDFPSAGNDYVVFSWTQALAGRPNQITAWVYGDGRGHFLNTWIKDSAGETRQFSFGQIKHQGWQRMTAIIDPNQPWPAGHISGPDNKAVDYPITFQALVLDDGADDYVGSGTIYIDDLTGAAGTLPPTPVPQPDAPPPTIIFSADRTTINPGGCAMLSWDVQNVAAVYLNGEGKAGQFSQQVCPAATTTYTLRVILDDGSAVDRSVTITVQ